MKDKEHVFGTWFFRVPGTLAGVGMKNGWTVLILAQLNLFNIILVRKIPGT